MVDRSDYMASEPRHYVIRHILKSAAKRGIDIFLAVVLLIGLAPLFALITLLVKTADGGSVIYSHTRIGRSGKAFPCLKFRTMVSDADAVLDKVLEENPSARIEWNEKRKIKDDPRIIKGIGHVLRKSSLDELPQLINVLRGEMSLVGPRPVTKDELFLYGPDAIVYASVRPGLTGPWQIGDRSDGTYQNRIKDDTNYVKTWSIAGDLWIIVRTAVMVLKGSSRGAY